jgi:hypothetical protein
MSELLMSALHAEEQHAPDPHEVLAGVARGVRRRARRSAAALAAGVALAVLAVSGAVVIAIGPAPPASVGAPVQGAFPADAAHGVNFGWLPDDVGRGGGPDVSAGGPYLVASVLPYVWTPTLDLTGWQRTEINGRPGRIVSRPTRTFLLWQLPSGHWAGLEFGRGMPRGADAQPGVELDARRIAAAITEAPYRRGSSRLRLTYLPQGYRVDLTSHATDTAGRSVDMVRGVAGTIRLTGTRTSYSDDGVTTESPTFAADGSFQVVLDQRDARAADDYVHRPGWTRIADVQGHPAYTNSAPNTSPGPRPLQIVVLDFHGGQLRLTSNFGTNPEVVVVGLAGGGPTYEELLEVANGIRVA